MAERVRCKMVCQSVTQRYGQVAVYGDQLNPKKVTGTERRPMYDAAFSAVYSEREDDENKKFWDATPSGSFNVATVKLMPWEPGKTYYIDVTEAPD